MSYFATIYIHPMQGNIPHAFLGLTHKHPDELDKQDEKAKQEKLKGALLESLHILKSKSKARIQRIRFYHKWTDCVVCV